VTSTLPPLVECASALQPPLTVALTNAGKASATNTPSNAASPNMPRFILLSSLRV
jgi:hypothetical protein